MPPKKYIKTEAVNLRNKSYHKENNGSRITDDKSISFEKYPVRGICSSALTRKLEEEEYLEKLGLTTAKKGSFDDWRFTKIFGFHANRALFDTFQTLSQFSLTSERLRLIQKSLINSEPTGHPESKLIAFPKELIEIIRNSLDVRDKQSFWMVCKFFNSTRMEENFIGKMDPKNSPHNFIKKWGKLYVKKGNCLVRFYDRPLFCYIYPFIPTSLHENKASQEYNIETLQEDIPILIFHTTEDFLDCEREWKKEIEEVESFGLRPKDRRGRDFVPTEFEFEVSCKILFKIPGSKRSCLYINSDLDYPGDQYYSSISQEDLDNHQKFLGSCLKFRTDSYPVYAAPSDGVYLRCPYFRFTFRNKLHLNFSTQELINLAFKIGQEVARKCEYTINNEDGNFLELNATFTRVAGAGNPFGVSVVISVRYKSNGAREGGFLYQFSSHCDEMRYKIKGLLKLGVYSHETAFKKEKYYTWLSGLVMDVNKIPKCYKPENLVMIWSEKYNPKGYSTGGIKTIYYFIDLNRVGSEGLKFLP